MAFSEEIISIKNGKGETMYGVLHNPENANGALVVMFNIGLHYRVCHSRLFVRQARGLQKDGFWVLRFDSSRIGYSQGEMPIGRAMDSFDAIQTGLFVDDGLVFIKQMRERLNPRKIFFTGLCGGALTAIIAAAADKNIDGVVFIAGPVTVTSPEHELSTLHPFQADILTSGYLKRVLSPSAWVRFFSGKTSYGELYKSFKTKLGGKFARKRKVVDEAGDLMPQEENKGEKFNRVFHQSFDTLAHAGKHILFLMPELDRATYDFDAIFAKNVMRHYTAYKDFLSVTRVPKANHTFSTPVSTRLLFEATREWLRSKLNSK
jgi:uncharacterized protein